MKRSPRGSSVTRTIREETIARVLEGSGPHVCVPWTGVDWTGRTKCTGFTYSDDRALLCYVIPEVIVRELKLFPGYLGTGQIEAPIDQEEQDVRKQTEEEVLASISKETAKEEFYRLLQRWTRLVKIVGYPETEMRYLPKNEDYQVLVLGPYIQGQHAVLSAQQDRFKDGRFLVALGVSSSKAAAKDAEANGQAKPGARAVAAVREFEASNQSNLVGAGRPVRGAPPRMRMGGEAPFQIYSPPQGKPGTREDVARIVNVDPANPYLPGGA